MMSFKKFLNEGAQFSIETFAKDCEFYIDLVKNSHQKIMYHGQKNRAGAEAEILDWHERTGPRDSPDAAHDRFNLFFRKKFGEPMRNWLFTTSNYNTAHLYGPVDAIFPIGQFEWVYTDNPDLTDLTGNITYNMYDIKRTAPTLSYDERKSMSVDLTVDAMHDSNWYHNEKFTNALNSESEIMIKCKHFYAVDRFSKPFEQIEELLKRKI